MKHRLKHGKLIPPKSVKDAVDRIAYLRAEIEAITAQLSDVARAEDRVRYPTPEDYEQWSVAARHSRQLYRAEDKQTVDWLRVRLLEQAHELFETLAEDTDLAPEEMAVVERIRSFYRMENRTARRTS